MLLFLLKYKKLGLDIIVCRRNEIDYGSAALLLSKFLKLDKIEFDDQLVRFSRLFL